MEKVWVGEGEKLLSALCLNAVEDSDAYMIVEGFDVYITAKSMFDREEFRGCATATVFCSPVNV